MKTPHLALVHATGHQFSRHLLEALREARWLEGFYTGVAVTPRTRWIRLAPPRLRAELERRTFLLPDEQLHTRPWREALRLASQRLGWHAPIRHETGWASVDQVFQDLDRAVARRLQRSGPAPTGIYGYEDGCLETFRVARARGLNRFYDLPIAYWETSRRLLQEEAERLPEWEPTLVGTRDSAGKLERKTEELALADVVVTPSLFVHRSLPESIRQSRPCLVAEFGSPPSHPAAAERLPDPTAKLRLLFAGSMSQRKGLGDLFAAMKLLHRSDVELVIMGSPQASMEFYRNQYRPFIYEATRPHEQVLRLMLSCDVLVLPSIVEGRALVQQEALAQGLPLIVTENAGGEDLVVAGETGFLVPMRSPEAIAEKIAWFADHRDQLPEMRRAAIRKAAEYPWRRYADLILAGIEAASP